MQWTTSGKQGRIDGWSHKVGRYPPLHVYNGALSSRWFVIVCLCCVSTLPCFQKLSGLSLDEIDVFNGSNWQQPELAAKSSE